MEELLKEILCELRVLNDKIATVGGDEVDAASAAVGDRKTLGDHVMEIYKKSIEINKNMQDMQKAKEQEKLYAVPNLIRKIVDENFSKYVGKVNTPSKITIINDDIKNGGIARVIIESHDASRYDFKAGIAPVLRGYKDCKAMPCTSAKSK